MIKIAYVTTAFPTLAWFIENEVSLQREHGLDIQVLTLRGVGSNFQPEHRGLLEITRAIGSPFAPAAWGALVRWLFKRPTVLIGETLRILWASKTSLYALAGHLFYLPAACRIASLAEAEDIDHLHGAWAHFPGTCAYLAARLTGRTFSLAGHAGGDLYRCQAFLAEKARAATHVTTCVARNGDMLRALAGPKARVLNIYHGVNLQRFDGEQRERSSEPHFICVGRLAETKGFDVAVRAIGILKQRGARPRLTIIGDGPVRQRIEEAVQESGVEDLVDLPGQKNHDELLPYYRSAWGLLAPSVVLASQRQDGIPNVIVEAMAMGIPVIGTDAGGIEEIVVTGETGAVVPQSDPVALADAIEPLLSDPTRLDVMGSKARGRVLREFDARRNVEQTMALFMECDTESEVRPAAVAQQGGAAR